MNNDPKRKVKCEQHWKYKKLAKSHIITSLDDSFKFVTIK